MLRLPPTPYAQKRTQTTTSAGYDIYIFFFYFLERIFSATSRTPKRIHPTFHHHHLASSVYQPTGENSQRDRYVQGISGINWKQQKLNREPFFFLMPCHPSLLRLTTAFHLHAPNDIAIEARTTGSRLS
jgi:hypothetical protein